MSLDEPKINSICKPLVGHLLDSFRRDFQAISDTFPDNEDGQVLETVILDSVATSLIICAGSLDDCPKKEIEGRILEYLSYLAKIILTALRKNDKKK